MTMTESHASISSDINGSQSILTPGLDDSILYQGPALVHDGSAQQSAECKISWAEVGVS